MLAQLQADPLTRAAFLVADVAAAAGGDGGGGNATTWRPPRVGELCCARPALAATLRGITVGGTQWLFGNASRLQTLAEEIQARGGVITADDLRNAQPAVRCARKSAFRGAAPLDVYVSLSRRVSRAF